MQYQQYRNRQIKHSLRVWVLLAEFKKKFYFIKIFNIVDLYIYFFKSERKFIRDKKERNFAHFYIYIREIIYNKRAPTRICNICYPSCDGFGLFYCIWCWVFVCHWAFSTKKQENSLVHVFQCQLRFVYIARVSIGSYLRHSTRLQCIDF